MKHAMGWRIVVGLFLLSMSGVLYLLHYLIFRDLYHIFYYLLFDIAFAFINILLVTLIIDGLLSYRAKQSMLKKLNMVIGSFYSEVGTQLIKRIHLFDGSFEKLARKLLVSNGWSHLEFAKVATELKSYEPAIDYTKGDGADLKAFLTQKRPFLLVLLENPNLLEHETFTNLLWAVFHLTEEVSCRERVIGLPAADAKHLSVDIKRAYLLLVAEWLAYMEHLKDDYPYLFSLALRTSPFDPHASVEVR